MSIAWGIVLALVIPAVAVALAGPNYDEPAPPIGWWAVIVVGEMVGAALGVAVAHG